MKKIRNAALLLLSLIGFSARAQTETVASEAKKLQQLYLSVGTGPVLTSGKDLHPFGGNLEINVTTGFGYDNLLRVGFKRNAFAGTFDPKTSAFSYLGMNYNTYFIPSTHLNAGYLTIGKRKAINSLLQLQAFGGFSFNRVSKPDQYPLTAVETYPPIWDYRIESSYKPGILFQAEAMFLPLRFAGLTLGAYYHFVPEISNGGLAFSLNLGKLK